MELLKKILPALIVILMTSTFSIGQDFVTFSDDLSNKIELYPNPAVEHLTIEIKNSELVKPIILLHNIIGNTIKIEVEKISEVKFRLELKDLPNGYYLVSIKDPGTNFNKTYKFLKK
jgi:hypothetical protein